PPSRGPGDAATEGTMHERMPSITPIGGGGAWEPAGTHERPERAALPPRSGQPWTDAEYEQILAAAREGVSDIAEVAERIGRSPQPTLQKAKRLLPVAERSAPVDRVLPLLRKHLEDPEYDWQRVTLEDPPPRPVINPPALTGIRGLRSPELVALSYAVGLAAEAVDESVVDQVGEELYRRGLHHELVRYRAERVVRRPGAEVTYDEAELDAFAWLRRVFPMPDHLPWNTWPETWSEAEPPDW